MEKELSVYPARRAFCIIGKFGELSYDIKYHIVWITKYRKPVLKRPIAERTRELVRMVCAKNDVEILAGHVGIDHIHLLVSVPPYLSVSKLVQDIKGSTSHKLQMEYKELRQYRIMRNPQKCDII